MPAIRRCRYCHASAAYAFRFDILTLRYFFTIIFDMLLPPDALDIDFADATLYACCYFHILRHLPLRR